MIFVCCPSVLCDYLLMLESWKPNLFNFQVQNPKECKERDTVVFAGFPHLILITSDNCQTFCVSFEKKDLLTPDHLGPPRTEQILWPRHCVQRTWGAELHPRLKVATNARFPSEPIQTNSKRQIPATARMILKGQESFVDAYSCFFDNLKQVLNMFLHLHWKSIIQKLPRGLEDFNRSHLNVEKHSHIPPRTSRY